MNNILKNTAQWLGVFSLLILVSFIIEINLLKFLIDFLIILELYLIFDVKKGILLLKNNPYLDFLVGIITFPPFLFLLSNFDFLSFLKLEHLAISYICMELIKLFREIYILEIKKGVKHETI